MCRPLGLQGVIEAHADQVSDALPVGGLRAVAIGLMDVQAVILMHTLLEIFAIFTRGRGREPEVRRMPWVRGGGRIHAVVLSDTLQFIRIDGFALDDGFALAELPSIQIILGPAFAVDRDQEGVCCGRRFRHFQAQAVVKGVILEGFLTLLDLLPFQATDVFSPAPICVMLHEGGVLWRWPVMRDRRGYW